MARRNARRRPQKKARSKTRSPLPAWLWFGAGLGCCLMGVLLYRLTTLPAPASGAAAAKVSAAHERPAEEGLKFRFYDALRQFSVKVDPHEKTGAPPPPKRSPTATADAQKAPPPKQPAAAQSKPAQRYFLQAGSFKQREQAEKRRIELLLLNTDADITRVRHDGTPWYRVRTGPYNSYQQVDSIRDRLLDEGIDTMVTRR